MTTPRSPPDSRQREVPREESTPEGVRGNETKEPFPDPKPTRATKRAGSPTQVDEGDKLLRSERNPTPAKKPTSGRGKKKVVVHKALVSGGCSCGKDCPVSGYGRRSSTSSMSTGEADESMEFSSPGTPSGDAWRMHMEAFAALVDKKLDKRFESLAKASDIEAMMTRMDNQAADISRVKFAMEDARSESRQARADLKNELKDYVTSLVGSGGHEIRREREPVDPMDDIERCSEDYENIEDIRPKPANPRYRQTGVRFNDLGDTTARARSFKAGARSREQEDSRISKYDRARRSIRVWPIAGRTKSEIEKNLTEFLSGALGLTEGQISDLNIERVERTGLPDNDLVHNELRIVTSSPNARDYLYSKGPKLAAYVDEDRRPTAGFRVDVPDFLGAEWKMLDELGFQIKRDNGPGTRKYVKYDDYNYSLYLEVRLPGSTTWTKITPESATRMRRKREREDLEKMNGWGKNTTTTISQANTVPLGVRRTRSPTTAAPAATDPKKADGQPWQPPRRQE